jgi:hypothetical protein
MRVQGFQIIVYIALSVVDPADQFCDGPYITLNNSFGQQSFSS